MSFITYLKKKNKRQRVYLPLKNSTQDYEHFVFVDEFHLTKKYFHKLQNRNSATKRNITNPKKDQQINKYQKNVAKIYDQVKELA